MTRNLLVGLCGFAESQENIFRDFELIEIQQTFYQPPRVPTAKRWRDKAPENFVFTLKAWQLLTHEATSPTYRRLKEPLSTSQRAMAGSFKWNPVTRMAWHRTQEIAAALKAEAIVFQTPRSFLPTRDNLNRLYGFFETIERPEGHLVFEPRGDAWTDEIVRRVIADLALVHAVDPLLRQSIGCHMDYFRLHGKPAYHYHYRYKDAELAALHNMLSSTWPCRVLFNNDRMADDARRFMRLLKSSL